MVGSEPTMSVRAAMKRPSELRSQPTVGSSVAISELMVGTCRCVNFQSVGEW
jgi:hypothetical protein